MRLSKCVAAVCVSLLLLLPEVMGQFQQGGLGGTRGFGASPDGAARFAAGVLERELEHLRAAHELTDRQIRHLQVAAKGAVESHRRMLAADDREFAAIGWAEHYDVEILHRNETLYIGTHATDLWLLDHPIWKNAVYQVVSDEERQAAHRRRKNHRRLAADLLATALDHYLRFTEAQYNSISDQLRTAAEKRLQHIRCASPGLLVVPLLDLVREQSDTILEPTLQASQLQAWDQLRSRSCIDLLEKVGLSVIDLEGGGGGRGAGFF